MSVPQKTSTFARVASSDVQLNQPVHLIGLGFFHRAPSSLAQGRKVVDVRGPFFALDRSHDQFTEIEIVRQQNLLFVSGLFQNIGVLSLLGPSIHEVYCAMALFS